jgi:hypothetical protein
MQGTAAQLSADIFVGWTNIDDFIPQAVSRLAANISTPTFYYGMSAREDKRPLPIATLPRTI